MTGQVFWRAGDRRARAPGGRRPASTRGDGVVHRPVGGRGRPIADAVATALLDAGRAVYVLDGDNVRHGLERRPRVLRRRPRRERAPHRRGRPPDGRRRPRRAGARRQPVPRRPRTGCEAHAAAELPFVEVFVDTPLAACASSATPKACTPRPRRRAHRHDRRRRPYEAPIGPRANAGPGPLADQVAAVVAARSPL